MAENCIAPQATSKQFVEHITQRAGIRIEYEHYHLIFNSMETKMQRTLRQWFPEAFRSEKGEEKLSDYDVLQHFAEYCIMLITEGNTEKEREPFKIIKLLYTNGTLSERNAIENEFFTVLAKEEAPGSLKRHLDLMPADLRQVYLKTILEN